jgi:hypothetical protein
MTKGKEYNEELHGRLLHTEFETVVGGLMMLYALVMHFAWPTLAVDGLVSSRVFAGTDLLNCLNSLSRLTVRFNLTRWMD